METIARVAERKIGAVPPASAPSPDTPRTIRATANFVLTESGRKASLLAGGDGHALQQITLDVPTSRLHLVSVDKQGVARLRLRPRYESDDERGIARIDAAPAYDEPPTIEELYRAAATNHELEARYVATRETTRSKQSTADRAVREAMADAFFADTSQRAISHPPPTPKRCLLESNNGRVLFDIATDVGRAKEVPLEAHRRFRADLRARGERNRQQRAMQLALHEEKKRYIAEWMAMNGTDEQKVRQADGMLPIDEGIEAIADQVFAAGSHLPRYVRDGAARLQSFLREAMGQSDLIVAPPDLRVRSAHAVKATAAQWSIVQQLRATLPDANVVLRAHIMSSNRLPNSPALTVFGALVTHRHGPFVLRREFVVNETGVSS